MLKLASLMNLGSLIIPIALVGCVADKTEPASEPANAPTTIGPEPLITCSKDVSGPGAIGGGNPSCMMTVTVTVNCASGVGRVFAVYGEANTNTLYSASTDAAYQCAEPVVLTRDGFDCAKPVAADVAWWTPTGQGPFVCEEE